MEAKPPISLDEFKKKRREFSPVIKDKTKRSVLDRVAVWITNHVGSMGFFMIIFAWTAIWLSWNMFTPKEARFDPFPGFVLWLFISNMIQLFLMPLIMIGQNVQSRHADLRGEADLKINTKAEFEIETILAHLEYQNKIILQILQDLENKS
ncbi:MAG TPA: DUF1003 domain-containing protein [Mucilaginibacter sp.]|jgi:uncharacterized membrane protein|nr:DUF1003 domain-containing protein [Mucilaginibacter sp.]